LRLGGWEGHIGILGPMRMRYALALALVNSVAEILAAPPPGDTSTDGGSHGRA